MMRRPIRHRPRGRLLGIATDHRDAVALADFEARVSGVRSYVYRVDTPPWRPRWFVRRAV